VTNRIYLNYMDEALCCLYCGHKIITSDLCGEVPCEHLLFVYVEGEMQYIKSRLENRLTDLHVLTDDNYMPSKLNVTLLQQAITLCNETYGNFILFQQDIGSDLGQFGLAQYEIE